VEGLGLIVDGFPAHAPEMPIASRYVINQVLLMAASYITGDKEAVRKLKAHSSTVLLEILPPLPESFATATRIIYQIRPIIRIATTKDPYRRYEGSVSRLPMIRIATTKDPYRDYEGSVSPLRRIRTAATKDPYRHYEAFVPQLRRIRIATTNSRPKSANSS
jgi:hypothetical protein